MLTRVLGNGLSNSLNVTYNYYDRKPVNGDVQAVLETLYWNDGEPDYERIHCKGITKNWRTGV